MTQSLSGSHFKQISHKLIHCQCKKGCTGCCKCVKAACTQVHCTVVLFWGSTVARNLWIRTLTSLILVISKYPQFSWKWALKCFSTPKFSIWPGGAGGHLGFDLSRSSEVKSNFPPHLKIMFMVATHYSYARNFMLYSWSVRIALCDELTTNL